MSVEMLKRVLKHLSSHSGTSIPAHFIYEMQELLAQPEQEPVAWHYVYNDGERPPKLTLRQCLAEYKRGYAKAEDDLKQEPLSEEELEQATQGMSEFAADMFKAGIVAAEKAHGIGADNGAY